MKLVPMLRTLRKGDTRARLSALRAGGRALDVAIMSSALRTGVVLDDGRVIDLGAEARKRGSKSVVKRNVVRLVTPGTLTEDSLLEARRQP